MREYVTTAGLVAVLAFVGQGLASQGQHERGDQGTVEDTLQPPAMNVGYPGQSDSMRAQPKEPSAESAAASDQGISETALPGKSETVTGKIEKINRKSGYFTLKTEEGEKLQLHADPALLTQQELTKGAEVTAHYEMRGKMKHVTLLEPNPSGAPGSTQQSPEPSPSAPGGQR